MRDHLCNCNQETRVSAGAFDLNGNHPQIRANTQGCRALRIRPPPAALRTENQADQPEERQHKDHRHKQPHEHELHWPKLREVGFMPLTPPHPEEGRGYGTNRTHKTKPGRR